MEDFIKRVMLLAKAKYDIEEDIMESFISLIEQCYQQEFTPRKTVEVIAAELYG
jgi:hypothetical protein